MMKFLKQVSASLAIGFGSICIIAAIYAPFNSDLTKREKIDQTWACLLVGVPVTGWGVWILRGLARKQQKEISDRLNTTFYKMVKENNGQLTVLRFAMEAQLPGKEARQYLDEKAREFQASFDVTENGDVTYRFYL